MVLFILSFLILVVTIFLIHLYKNRQFYKLSLELPGPLWLPVIGNAFKFFCKNEDLFDAAVEICNAYPSPMRFWFGTKLTIVITDVQHAEKIMSSVKFATKDDVYKFIEPFNGKGLITSSGVKWKRDRRLMAPLFLKKNIMQYFPSVLNHTKIMIDILEKKVGERTFNVHAIIHNCVADIVNETLIGVKTKIQCGELEEFISSIKSAYILCHCRIVKVWLQNDFLYKLSPYWRKHKEAWRHINNFFQKALSEAEAKHTYSVKNSAVFRSIVDQLIDIKKELPDFATNDEMIHHLVTLYSASEDTTTIITSFTLVLLGMYPEIQKKAVNEIHNIIGKNKRDVEEYDLPKLEYLDMIIKEVLRLFPIAPFIIRKSLEEFELDGKIIPKDCSIIVSIHNIHRDEKYWEKPHSFYPNHFLPEAVRQRHPYSFMPFSAGPRGCVGKPYAYMAMKVILVTILQSFKIEADGKIEDMKLKQDISVRFKDDLYNIRLTKR